MPRGFVGPTLVLAAILSACQPQTDETTHSDAEEHRALIERYFEEFDADPSLEVVDQWLTASFVSHEAGGSEVIEFAAYRESLLPFFTGFSDIRHVIRESVSEGDRIALLVDITLQHTGDFAGIGATGRTVHVSEMLILRIEGGKIAEEWILFDSATFLAQLQP